ncbi:centrosomal protein of 44 kDa isoform X2 [Hyperolius riggenbachi]|uniref:centrosomal protein of 44 kDa isoform X2 n=1 Tax=Hyperolius riggenbachi TaxID=752182 RepID=UPI0035A29742
MTTGDIKGVLRKLEQRLRILNYPRDVDYSGLVKGDPAASLPILNYTFTAYSTRVAEILVSLDVELSSKSDLRFIDAVYKVLRDVFHYKPVLTKQQFLQCAFAERKIQTVCDIIDCVVKRHKEITNHNKVKLHPAKRMPSAKDKCEVFYPEESSVQATASSEKPLQKKLLVERHTGSDIPSLQVTSVQFESPAPEDITSSESEGDGPQEDMEYCNPKKSLTYLRLLPAPCRRQREEACCQGRAGAVTCHIKVANTVMKDTQIDLLKAQLAECQEKLSRLEWMEDRLQALENSMKGKIIIDDADWTNLLSRVLLLETDRLLQSKKKDLTAEFTAISEDRTSSRMTNEISTDCNTKADIPERNHQSSGYSSLLSADTSPVASDINYRRLTENSKEGRKREGVLDPFVLVGRGCWRQAGGIEIFPEGHGYLGVLSQRITRKNITRRPREKKWIDWLKC